MQTQKMDIPYVNNKGFVAGFLNSIVQMVLEEMQENDSVVRRMFITRASQGSGELSLSSEFRITEAWQIREVGCGKFDYLTFLGH